MVVLTCEWTPQFEKVALFWIVGSSFESRHWSLEISSALPETRSIAVHYLKELRGKVLERARFLQKRLAGSWFAKTIITLGERAIKLSN